MSGKKINTQFFHGISGRSDMTDLGRRLHFDACRSIDVLRLGIILQEAVDAGRLHPRKAELYHAQASTLLAQLTSDMAIQDAGWMAERAGNTDPVGRLRATFEQFTRYQPENAADEAAIGREIMRVAHTILAAVPPTSEEV